MRHIYRHEHHHPFSPEDGRAGWHRGHHGHGHHHRHGGRPFDYGELRLLALSMIAEQPRHGYELMRGIEERMGGSYSPSPGVMYPTLSWLADSGFAEAEEAGGRKSYRITPEGEAFLAENRAALEHLLARIGAVAAEAGGGGRRDVPAPVLRGMENLKLALRLRMRRGAIGDAAAHAIAAALDGAARIVEKSE